MNFKSDRNQDKLHVKALVLLVTQLCVGWSPCTMFNTNLLKEAFFLRANSVCLVPTGAGCTRAHSKGRVALALLSLLCMPNAWLISQRIDIFLARLRFRRRRWGHTLLPLCSTWCPYSADNSMLIEWCLSRIAIMPAFFINGNITHILTLHPLKTNFINSWSTTCAIHWWLLHA